MSGDARPHVMQYAAGAHGLGALGFPNREPGWSCICGGWAFAAKPIPHRKTGNNKIEALRSYQQHVETRSERKCAMSDVTQDECPIQLVLGGDFYDCALPKGHAGQHDYSEPNADSDPSVSPITITFSGAPVLGQGGAR